VTDEKGRGAGEGGKEAGDRDEELTLEERLRRLDQIVATLEGGDVELERGLALFEEGVRHIRKAEALLAEAELRVEELVGEAESLGTRPLEEDEEG
jgi:exodeoxyribonuclease VII small subunit